MVRLVLAKPVEEENDDDDEPVSHEERERRTNTSEIIPEDNVRVIVDPLWIENIVNLRNKRIIADLGDVPVDDEKSEIKDLQLIMNRL